MGSRSYRIELALRIVALCATMYLFFFLAVARSYPLTAALVGLASGLQCLLLASSVDRRNRILSRFLEAVRSSDFGSRAELPPGRSFDRLKAEYELTLEALRARELELERSRLYSEIIAESAGIGFAVLDDDGRLGFSNEAFKSLLGTYPQEEFRTRASLMRNGERTTLDIERSGARLRLLVSARDLAIERRKYRLLSAQSIESELAANELDAWQSLARVLMHEIMNSLAPISSLAFSAKELASKALGGEAEAGRDALMALDAIGRRSRSLLGFVDNYRKLLRVPEPVRKSLSCGELFAKVRELMLDSLTKGRIDLKLDIMPPNLRVRADEGLVEQVLINLVKNSIEALDGAARPYIELRARSEPGGRVVIEVADNGRGIPEEDMEKIFIPFFTTRAEGSGVGLSLCRQIMRLHGGSISASSAQGERTVFKLAF